METPNLFELSVDGASSGFLKETSRWAKFLSVVGFVMVGLMILISLSIIGLGSSNALLEASLQNAGYSSPMMVGVIYLVMALVSIFPYLYLFQFGSRMKTALDASDQDALNSAFSSLKSCFKFVGVFTIIMLAFLILAFAVMIVVAVTGGV